MCCNTYSLFQIPTNAPDPFFLKKNYGKDALRNLSKNPSIKNIKRYYNIGDLKQNQYLYFPLLIKEIFKTYYNFKKVSDP